MRHVADGTVKTCEVRYVTWLEDILLVRPVRSNWRGEA